MSHDAYRELGEFFPALPERRFEKFTGYWYNENNDWYCNNCEMFFYEGKEDPVCCCYCNRTNIEIL